ncbi:hypothetical protein EDC44_10454 [Cricetibacter osteomyelitidis]|uniref:Uncharacterized protein n=1 Tax=Cricetibacter osteomyelitidis TaxID=1521931 RepID=A0A4R2T4S6_9PAST|nr:hypothetical protein [Cricetibacter osteomyelitidis]TCP96521.1 hypothetical protein EDC44_10454 [Cricetibacter osteomyelitidis]
MNKLFFFSFFILLSSCNFIFPMSYDPAHGGAFFYNFCEKDIEWRNERFSDKEYENNKKYRKKIIKSGESLFAIFTMSEQSYEERKESAKKEYFIEEGSDIKKYFLFDMPFKEGRENFIACPENAKPTGDGNWIRAK